MNKSKQNSCDIIIIEANRPMTIKDIAYLKCGKRLDRKQ